MDVQGQGAVADGIPSAAVQVERRRLMARDALTFLTLTAVALVLGAVTTLLFRSFERHREDLAERWAERGRQELAAGHSAAAVEALRTSLSYRPDDTANQMTLAEALAASGRSVEAENYYLNLWQAKPGDGPLNLQMARLERSRGNAQQAVEYYRAAVFGMWAGDAPVRRRDTRLELSRYLIERGQIDSARAELLVAAGNNPDAATQIAIGQLLEQANDAKDALTAYRNAAEGADRREDAQARIGELCYRMGDYGCAEDALEKALRYKRWTAEQASRLGKMRQDAARLQELAFSQGVPAAERAAHMLADALIVQQRLTSCLALKADGGAEESAPGLQSLQDRWKQMDTAKNRAALRRDDDLQDGYTGLIWETENVMAQACGAPAGDDALLEYLQAHPLTRFGEQ